jgi:hypothetical protein
MPLSTITKSLIYRNLKSIRTHSEGLKECVPKSVTNLKTTISSTILYYLNESYLNLKEIHLN